MKLLLVLVGIGLFGYGLQEVRLGGVAKPEPQTITCKDLGEKGPGDNAHVRMTDYTLLTADFAVERRKKQTDEKWNKAWIPAVPKGTTLQTGEPHRVLVHVDKRDSDQKTLDELEARPVIEGTVINEIDKIGDDVRKVLEASYPLHPVDKAWILEVDRKPRPAYFGYGAIALGLLSLGLAIRAFVRGRRRRQAAQAPATPAP